MRAAIPDGLSWWRNTPEGAAWLDRLPRLIDECAQLFGVEPGEPFQPASVSYVARAGDDAVLKINFPEDESAAEPDALALWNGDGAVKLLAHDRERRALLLERAHPGASLHDEDDDTAATTICTVLRRIWRAPPPSAPFARLREVAARWAHDLPAQLPGERALVDEAVALVRDLLASEGDVVVCHQDLHAGNVLRATRAPWLVIDPKPIVGERAFDLASLVRDRRPTDARTMRRRIDIAADALGLDKARIRGWALVHALAWCAGSTGPDADMLAVARILSARHTAR